MTFLFLASCICLNAQKGVVSKWRNDPSAEMKMPDSDYMSAKKGKVLYCVSNDEKNIFVDMKISDVAEQNRILHMGLTVWIDSEGKSRKKLGIRYPIGSQFNRGRTENVVNPPSPLAQANTIQLIGFDNTEVKRFPSDNVDNIRGTIKYDNDGDLVYYLCIPLDRVEGGISVGTGQMPLSLGIEYGAMPEMPGQARPMTGMAAQGGSSGGRGGGSRGASMRGGLNRPRMNTSMPPSSSNPPPVMIWMKGIKLATK
jgi:hypothetical protein